jgi:hypothetical protein
LSAGARREQVVEVVWKRRDLKPSHERGTDVLCQLSPTPHAERRTSTVKQNVGTSAAGIESPRAPKTAEDSAWHFSPAVPCAATMLGRTRTSDNDNAAGFYQYSLRTDYHNAANMLSTSFRASVSIPLCCNTP